MILNEAQEARQETRLEQERIILKGVTTQH